MEHYQELSLFAELSIVVITLVYAVFAGGQWWQIRQQTDIANKTLQLTQRPKLRVRDVGVILTHLANREAFTPNPIRVVFEVANIGGNPARIQASHSDVILTNGGLPMRVIDEKWQPNTIISKQTLEPGDIRTVSFICEKPIGIHLPDVYKRFHSSLYVMGYIDYTDKLNLTRRTSFCRRFIRTEEGACFAPEENPNYEYED